jgi:hypothetical protein
MAMEMGSNGHGDPTKTFQRPHGGFHKWGSPKMDGLEGKIQLKWMI